MITRWPCLNVLTSIAFAFAIACGGSAPAAEPEPAPSEPEDTTRSWAPHDEVEVIVPPIAVVSAEHTPYEGTAPELRILSPRNGELIRRGNVQLRLSLTGWELSPEGNHVHVILDNEPYIPVRNTSEPIDLNELVTRVLGHELSEGSHVIRVFPSRGHHESVKDARAFAAIGFHYRRRTPDFEFSPTAPLLTYSRPKGCNEVGRPVLLDFFVSGGSLGPVCALGPEGCTAASGYNPLDHLAVEYTIGDLTGTITEWTPHFIMNLPPGEHQLSLRLLDPQGVVVPGPFNETTRSFTVAESCP